MYALEHALLQEVFRRHLESCYAKYPEIEEDGANLPDVLIKLWSVAKEDVAPKSCLLGTKTIYVSKPRCVHVCGERGGLVTWVLFTVLLCHTVT
jgi:hypothetical protein